MLFISYFVAAAAALSIPRSSGHSKHLDSRAAGVSGHHHAHSRFHSLTIPAHLENRDEPNPQLNVRIENKLNESVRVYITGTVDGQFALVQVAGNGQSSFKSLPTAPANTNGINITGLEPITVPSGGKDFTLPGYITSGRLYVSKQPSLRFRANVDGNNKAGLEQPDFMSMSDPAVNVTWGFMEFNYSPTELFINLSFVDFVSLALGMSMTYMNGANEETATIGGLHKGSVESMCDEIKALGAPWADLCYQPNGEAIRVVAPEKYMSVHPGGAFDTYYDSYVNQVWSKYSTQDLIINTQDDGAGNKTKDGLQIPCRVEDEKLNCKASNGSTIATFEKPTSRDIFGCAAAKGASPFAHNDTDPSAKKNIIPRLCAAFSRSTLLRSDRPMEVAQADYYTNDVTNHYAKLVHAHLVEGKGYAFSYDDVNMDPLDPKENTAGVIEKANPKQFNVMVGGA